MHDKIHMLAESKLNSIEKLISKTLWRYVMKNLL